MKRAVAAALVGLALAVPLATAAPAQPATLLRLVSQDLLVAPAGN